MAVWQWSRFGVQYEAAVLDVKTFDPDQPRGWHGRWIRIGSVVRLHGGGRATVVDSVGDWYRVRHNSGHVSRVHSRQIAEVVSSPTHPRNDERLPPRGVQPGRAANAADLAALDERLWDGLDPAGRRKLTELDARDHDLFMRNRALAKRQISQDLTRRIEHVDDRYVLDEPVRAALGRLRSGEAVMVRSPTPYVALHQQPNSPDLPNELADWHYQEILPEEFEDAQQSMDMSEFEVIDADRYRAIHREQAVAGLVNAWAFNAVAPRSLALQLVARDMFGLDSTTLDGVDNDRLVMAEEILERVRPFVEAFVRAQYDATQEWLRDAGAIHVHVQRGMVWNILDVEQGPPDWARSGRGSSEFEAEVPLRPLSSFTLSPFTAQEFVGQEGDPDWGLQHGVVLDGTVPAERIFALPRTGIGCLDEWEAVILGGADRWRVTARVGKYRYYLQHLIDTADSRYEQVVAIELARSMDMMELIPDSWITERKALPIGGTPVGARPRRKSAWDVWNGGRLATDLETCVRASGMSREETARDLLARQHEVDVPAELLEECRRLLGDADT
ncbi:hypothetical protein ACIBHY_29570 [Nonomuraea sp. NPDC050547]|uniref:hypothetical protein n=1 Tax=Nonomuraea sp. NPDC050547 TaxID=3364368 RepID=UPI00378FE456